MSDFSVIQQSYQSYHLHDSKDDSSLWSCVVYEFWSMSDILDDLYDRINNMTKDNYETTFRHVYEGSQFISDSHECNQLMRYLKNRGDIIFKYEEKIVKRREEIADKIIQLQIDIENSQIYIEEGIKEGIISMSEINRRKLHINNELKSFEQSGARNEDMKILGKLLKGVNSEIETLIKLK